MRKFWQEIRGYVLLIILVILIRTYLATPAIVDGESMENTLYDGEVVIINKIAYGIVDIERFDIVVLKNEEDDDKIIKRIIGLPNETIEYRENTLYVNGLKIVTSVSFEDTEDFKVETGDGEYFVLGDNRDVSKDSRMLGNFTEKDFIGRVGLRIYPFNKIGFVK